MLQRMLKCVLALGFISEFSRAQFDRRFPGEGDLLKFTALCSTNSKEYGADEREGASQDDGYVLLVGNSFEHKFIKSSCDLFSQHAPEARVAVLGCKVQNDRQIVSYESGQLDDAAAAELYARARLVMFPARYEGFGTRSCMRWRIESRSLPGTCRYSGKSRSRVRESGKSAPSSNDG